MIRDVESFRIQVHQSFALFDGDEDDDRLAALVKPNEQLASDFEAGVPYEVLSSTSGRADAISRTVSQETALVLLARFITQDNQSRSSSESESVLVVATTATASC